MSRSTRSLRADRARRAAGPGARLAAGLVALALPLLALAHHQRVDAPPLPPAVAALAPDVQAQGGGELRHFGFRVYDGWYWGPGHDWSLAAPFALDLHYHRTLAGAGIAERSVEEIARLGLGTAAQLARWGEAMRGIFPDVRAGDRLTGVFLPPGVVRYFSNGAPIGEIADPAFARAFFGIWLDPRTSRADFRAKLLGGS
jgi:hypothetical protein